MATLMVALRTFFPAFGCCIGPIMLTFPGRHTLIPPRGYTICGVTGSCAAWVDGFSVIIVK
jgi:hypothetical protein